MYIDDDHFYHYNANYNLELLYWCNDKDGGTGQADQAATGAMIISKSQEQIKINDWKLKVVEAWLICLTNVKLLPLPLNDLVKQYKTNIPWDLEDCLLTWDSYTLFYDIYKPFKKHLQYKINGIEF